MTLAGRSVAVRVPATSANLGPGFDTLGLALSVHDELVVTVLDGPGLEIEVSGEGAADVPTDASHLVIRSMDGAFVRDIPLVGESNHVPMWSPDGKAIASKSARAGAICSGISAPTRHPPHHDPRGLHHLRVDVRRDGRALPVERQHHQAMEVRPHDHRHQ